MTRDQAVTQCVNAIEAHERLGDQAAAKAIAWVLNRMLEFERLGDPNDLAEIINASANLAHDVARTAECGKEERRRVVYHVQRVREEHRNGTRGVLPANNEQVSW